MTLGQFFLGLVAIVVATIIFRWQKSIDRQSEMAVRRFEAYRRCLQTVEECEQNIWEENCVDSFQIQAKLDANFNELFLIAPFEVIDGLRLTEKGIAEFADAVAKAEDAEEPFRHFLLAFELLKREMRKDVISSTQFRAPFKKDYSPEKYSSEKYAHLFKSKSSNIKK